MESPVEVSSLARFVRRETITCHPGETVRHALEVMRSRSIGSMIVIDEARAPIGILTLRDVVDRIALEDGALETPIERYMSSPPFTLATTDSTYDAALVMIRHGVRHVILLEAREVAGVVSERDLFGLQSAGLRQLSTAIRGAHDMAQIEAYGRDIGMLARQLLAQGSATGPLTAFVSSLIDLLTERIVELEFATAGIELDRVCWIVMGSEGRGEQTLATDQDNGLIFQVSTELDLESTRSRLTPVCQRINRALDRAGYKLCSGNIMAGNPTWCLSPQEWRARFARWIDSGSPDALLHGSIFFDLRPLAANRALGRDLRQWMLEAVPQNRRFLHQMAVNALGNHPPVGLFGRLRPAADGSIDLKINGASAFVDAARIFSLASGIDETRTETRLRASGRSLGIASHEIEAWISAFYCIQRQRLKRQASCLDAGREPDNKIEPGRLNDFDRQMLLIACRQALGVQKRLALDFQV
jgi:CBS domain-containing protein